MSEKRHTAYRFGDKLRQVRERQNFTLKALSAVVGVSSSLLSQIENNRISPSLDTLMSITEALEIDPEYLFEEIKQPREVSIVRKNERDGVRLRDVLYEQVSPSVDASDTLPYEIIELTVPPQGRKGSSEFGHPGRETGLIMEGTAILHYGSKTYQLQAHDSVTFASRVPHILENVGENQLKAIWVISPPRMFSKNR
ncbi:MAG: helix-turn-helix domain-containing protein [Spirochaetota bacterium]